MDAQTLKSDIDVVVKILEAVEGFLPNGARLQTYTTTVQAIVENPTLLALFAAWINTLVPAPTPAK